MYGQKFSAAIVLGFNASQIDGDGYAGYSKVGFTGGARLQYPLSDKSSLNLEFLYSQRGSRSSLFSSDQGNFGINLNYAEIPVLYSLNDWFIEKESYYKVGFDAGLSYGRLITASSRSGAFDEALNNLKKNDISYILGLRYKFNPRWGLTVRYTRGLAKMYVDEKLEFGGLLGYFLTCRTEYYF